MSQDPPPGKNYVPHWQALAASRGIVDPFFMTLINKFVAENRVDPFYSKNDSHRSAYHRGIEDATKIPNMDGSTLEVQFVKLFGKEVVAMSLAGLNFNGVNATGTFIGELCTIESPQGALFPGIRLSKRFNETAKLQNLYLWNVAETVFPIDKFNWIVRSSTYCDIRTRQLEKERIELQTQLQSAARISMSPEPTAVDAMRAMSVETNAAVGQLSAIIQSMAENQGQTNQQFREFMSFQREQSQLMANLGQRAPSPINDLAMANEIKQLRSEDKFERNSRASHFMVDLSQASVLEQLCPKGFSSQFATSFKFKAPGDMRDKLCNLANKCLGFWIRMTSASNPLEFIMNKLPKIKDGGMSPDTALLLQRSLSAAVPDYTLVVMVVMRYDDGLKEYTDFANAAHFAWLSDWDSGTFKDFLEKGKAAQFTIGNLGEFCVKKPKNH